MAGPTHDDLHRDIGELEAGQHAMEKRLDRLEDMIVEGFKEIRSDLAALKLKDGQRSALEKAGVWLSGVIGAGLALVIQHLWK